jgi:hypothetical protein
MLESVLPFLPKRGTGALIGCPVTLAGLLGRRCRSSVWGAFFRVRLCLQLCWKGSRRALFCPDGSVVSLISTATVLCPQNIDVG